jgi:hypothetical protein
MTAVQAIREDTSQRALGQRHSAWPRAVAAATVAWSLWQVRATVGPAHYPNGPDATVRWSLYLLWCLWPAAIYACARVFRLAPQAAAPRLAAAIKGFFDLEPVRPGQHYPPVRLPGQRAEAAPVEPVPPEAASSALNRKQTDA